MIHTPSRATIAAIITAITVATAATVPACGDLDETDADPPSLRSIALWDASQLVAVRTYYKEPVLVDVATGRQTGKLHSGKYYEDVEPIGNGELIGLHHQSIDFLTAAGQVDATRSLSSDLFTHMALSADRSTLAYAQASDPTTNSIGIIALASDNARFSPPGVSFNLGESLSLSRDGKLVAFATGDVGVARTRPPDPATPDIPAVTACLVDGAPDHLATAMATAFSPVEDKLAVSKDDGSVNIFDLSHYPECRLLTSIAGPAPAEGGQLPVTWHVQYSPDGNLLAVSMETITAHASDAGATFTGVVRVYDVHGGSAGVPLEDLAVYEWEQRTPPPFSAPLITDLQWSGSSDRLAVSTANGPLQQWDVAKGSLLWSAKL